MASPTFSSNLPPGRGGYDPTIELANKYGLIIDIWGMHCQKRASFKAILESYRDQFDTQLESSTFVGNPQPYRKQKTIERTTSIGLSLPAYSVSEAKANLKMVGQLVKMLHPKANPMPGEHLNASKSYAVVAGGDPIFKVKFLNLLSDGSAPAGQTADAEMTGVTGYIDNLSYDFVLDNEGGGFLSSAADRKGYVYPRLIKMSFTFYPFEPKVALWPSDTPGIFSRPHFPYQVRQEKKGDQVFAEAPTADKLGGGNVVSGVMSAAVTKALGGDDFGLDPGPPISSTF